MLESDRKALQELLLSICIHADPRAPSEFDLQGIVSDVLCETHSVLADYAYSLNEKHTCCRMPGELLAACLSFLPFRFRMRASGISRSWRAAALATPSLWAEIDEEPYGHLLTVPALQLALSRASAVPLSLEFGRELKGTRLQFVDSSLHRVEHLQLYRITDTTLLEQPAPMLRTLRVMTDVVRLTQDFLSGCPGRLSSLRTQSLSFDNSCPALSNLTTLRTDNGGRVRLQEIFAMCPRLQKLWMGVVSAYNVGPLGRPPRSLSELCLVTHDNAAHLIAVFAACRPSSNLKRVELYYRCDTRACELCDAHRVGLALHGGVNLSVFHDYETISIEATHSGGLYLILGHMIKHDPRDAFPQIFAQRSECFANLRTLTMPLSALHAFVANAPPTPAQLEITLQIFPESGVHGPPTYPWDLLRALAALAQTRVVLDVQPYVANFVAPVLPAADDARALVRELANLDGPFEFRVAGFAPDIEPCDTTGLPRRVSLVFV